MEPESDSWQHWESDFFTRLRLRMSSWIIFYITLLNWEFLLKCYNFFWNFCWNKDFLLCTTISIDFNSQFHPPYGKESGVGNFEMSESAILERSDILPPTPQPWIKPCCVLCAPSGPLLGGAGRRRLLWKIPPLEKCVGHSL